MAKRATVTPVERAPHVGDGGANVALIRGECSTTPDVRLLESGSRVASLAVRCPAADGRTTSVPVTVWEPPSWVEALGPGDHVVVVGALRRRFYRGAGGVGSRVDLESTGIARTADGRRVRALVKRVAGLVDDFG